MYCLYKNSPLFSSISVREEIMRLFKQGEYTKKGNQRRKSFHNSQPENTIPGKRHQSVFYKIPNLVQLCTTMHFVI